MDMSPAGPAALPDLVCFSHLRWDFVFQRPQQLMSRFARTRRVLFVEEPIFEPVPGGQLRVTSRPGGVDVAVPVLPEGVSQRDAIDLQHQMLAQHVALQFGPRPTFWFQTPMAHAFAPTELAGTVIYDCMDELSGFDQAPPALVFNEKQLLSRADLVFTGGHALYEAKQGKHPNVHCFPSGIDTAHFSRARTHQHGAGCDPEWEHIPHPRVGFAGVIDERMDLSLLAGVADALPRTHFLLVGPVVKIDPATLPARANIHYLGMRHYTELPELMGEWDVAVMPFARNDATRFISPTKTPEYLAAGLPVISTSVRDVVRQYGDAGLVHIADTVTQFADAIVAAVGTRNDPARLRAVDAALQHASWDAIRARMAMLERSLAGSRSWQADTADVR